MTSFYQSIYLLRKGYMKGSVRGYPYRGRSLRTCCFVILVAIVFDVVLILDYVI